MTPIGDIVRQLWAVRPRWAPELLEDAKQQYILAAENAAERAKTAVDTQKAKDTAFSRFDVLDHKRYAAELPGQQKEAKAAYKQAKAWKDTLRWQKVSPFS